MELKLYNTMTRAKEIFQALGAEVGLYTCGPTVYNFAHIGNLRTYIFEDVLKRTLVYNGFRVKHVMNITDVGHLVGDGDMGEDKLEAGARREGKTAWAVAREYEEAFLDDVRRLNILAADVMPRATEHIAEQIAMIKTLADKDFTYRTSDGIYYDTSKFADYNRLSHLELETLREGARVEVNPEKRNPTDFALWKFSFKGGGSFDPAQDGDAARRQMEWESPWGVGFPGWHIECSAMSMKYLGQQFDIHCGGADHVNVHHTNEIAQSEAATGKHPWVKYWLHGEFLNITGGKKMAKSEGNFLTLRNALLDRGIDPLAYRFAALGTHYRKPMEYSEEAMANAQEGYRHLQNQVKDLGIEQGNINEAFRQEFLTAVNDDLNTPQALAVVQKVLKSDLDSGDRLATISDFNRILGLGFVTAVRWEGDPVLGQLIVLRAAAKSAANWGEADRLRHEIEDLGYTIEDAKDGVKVYKK